MRLRLNLKTACTTTMPPQFIDITHWDVSAVVLVLMLFTKWYWFAKKLNYFITSLVIHHTLGFPCSSFSTYDVHKVVPVKSIDRWKIELFHDLASKNEVEVKFENSMHNYNAILVHWHHTFGCQCSSFGTSKTSPIKQSKHYWRTNERTNERTNGRTDKHRQSNNTQPA